MNALEGKLIKQIKKEDHQFYQKILLESISSTIPYVFEWKGKKYKLKKL